MQTNESYRAWQTFDTSSVRDLAWLLLSPPLFERALNGFGAFELDIDSQIHVWLRTLDAQLSKDPDHYPLIAKHRYRRIGIYGEALMEFLFTEGWRAGVIPYQMLARNVQVNAERRTIGECDFIVESRNGEITHIELALKYYLQHHRADTHWSNWIGPNAIDRLDKKLARMLEHQLPMGNHPGTRAKLKEVSQAFKHSPQAPIDSQYVLKGCLFNPAQDWPACSTTPTMLPEQGNTQLLRGYWSPIDSFCDAPERHDQRIYPCAKMEWLCGPTPSTQEVSPSTLKMTLEQINHDAEQAQRLKVPMLVHVADKKDKRQIAPVMLVPNHWPEISSPSRIM